MSLLTESEIKEIKSADFSFLKKMKDKELSQRLDIVRSQVPKAVELAEKGMKYGERALLQLQTQEDAIIAERMSRI